MFDEDQQFAINLSNKVKAETTAVMYSTYQPKGA
jgi:hypothetical protein